MYRAYAALPPSSGALTAADDAEAVPESVRARLDSGWDSGLVNVFIVGFVVDMVRAGVCVCGYTGNFL